MSEKEKEKPPTCPLFGEGYIESFDRAGRAVALGGNAEKPIKTIHLRVRRMDPDGCVREVASFEARRIVAPSAAADDTLITLRTKEEVIVNGVQIPIWDNWLPKPEDINRLPEPLRDYIHDLETRCDPAGDVQRLFLLDQENKALRAKLEAGFMDKAFAEDRTKPVPKHIRMPDHLNGSPFRRKR